MRAPPPSHESLLGAEKPCWWERTISCSLTVRSSPPPMRPGPFNFPKDCMCKQPVTERGREKNCAFPFFYHWTVHLETLNGQLLVAWSLESGNPSRCVRARRGEISCVGLDLCDEASPIMPLKNKPNTPTTAVLWNQIQYLSGSRAQPL